MAEVDLSNLRPNSHTYRESLKNEETEVKKERLKPVVKSSKVVSTKKPLSKKLADFFIKEDVKDIKEYILMEVLIPGIKDFVFDGISMMLYGKVVRGRSGGSRSYGRVDYASKYRSSSSMKRSRDREEYLEDDKVNYKNIILLDRQDAEEVVEQLHRRIEDLGSASIAELFDLIGVAGKHTDNNWGWTSSRQIGIKRVRDGFLIDVDTAEYIG